MLMKKLTDIFRTADGKNYLITFILVTSLFLLWGFCNGLIDVLNKHFQNSLNVTKTQSAFVQMANYMGYFFMAIPSGLLARRFGYKGGIIIGLALIATGAFWFIPATQIGTYWAFLLGLFILATGLTCLETIANPYTTVLGPSEFGAARINLAQSANGIGWILGPLIGGRLILSATDQVNRSNESLYKPYLGIGIVVAVLAVIFVFARVPDLQAEEECKTETGNRVSAKPFWKRWHFLLAVAAQFFYVAAQTGIFSFFINYIVDHLSHISEGAAKLLNAYAGGLHNAIHLVSAWLADVIPSTIALPKDGHYFVSEQGASFLLSLGGFLLFLLGRFVGSVALRFFKAHWTLALFSLINILMMALVVAPLGWISVMGLFLSFFFMSIMFPTIFALGIHGLGEQTKKASSFIVMAIVGGAIMPMFMGWLADNWGMRIGFVMPLICFVVIAAYGLFWRQLEARDVRSSAV